MAQTDLRYEHKNNQKKESSVFASGSIATAATLDAIMFTLPRASIVTNVRVIVLTASGTATDTVDVKVGSTVVANEAVVGVLGVGAITTVTPTYFETGGIVTVVAGADAPDAAGVFKLIVEYIETELSEGTYTD